MNWMTPEVLIAIYAAAISTFVFIWKLIERYNEIRGRIQIDSKIMTQTIVNYDRTLGDSQVVLTFKIINKGHQPRYVERPGLETNRETERGKYLQPINLEDKTTYPIILNAGQVFETSVDLTDIRQTFANMDLRKAKRIRAYCKDTFGKTYKSKWMSLREFLDKN